MEQLDSEFGPVELTAERLSHILDFHLEIRSFLKYLPQTLSKPEIIGRSKSDPKVLIFYRTVKPQKFLAIVIKTNFRNFILTAYLTDKIQHSKL